MRVFKQIINQMFFYCTETGAVTAEFHSSAAADAVPPELGTDAGSGRHVGSSLVQSRPSRGNSDQHPGMDVLLHHLLDAVCSLRSLIFMYVYLLIPLGNRSPCNRIYC